MNNLVIIPSLNPNEKLIKLVNDLKKRKIDNILIIDDGSKDVKIFDELEKNDIKVIHHDKNYGKGKALKTAFENYDRYFKDIKGFITADSDGQHAIDDIINIYNLLDKNIIFGVRNFKEKDVPFKSKLGNKLSSIILRITTGMKLNDTQTGLRGFPISYKEILLSIDGDRFEYEMNVLMYLAKHKIPVQSVSIKTIYEDNNKGSNYKPFKDSIKIFTNIFKKRVH